MRKITHLVPYDGIGGVETAARSMGTDSVEGITFVVDYVYPPTIAQHAWYAMYNPWPILRAVHRVLAGKPDVLIVSLWRSCVVALLTRLFYRRPRLVLFLHSPSDAHWLDRLATRFVAAFACEIWADSQETLNRRLPVVPPRKGRVISFVTHRTSPLPPGPVKPMFIFWGRLHPWKRLGRALRIFAAVHKTDASARFLVIGPDGGDLAHINAMVEAYGLTDAVHFAGSLDFDAISQCAGLASFYLQTSSVEGMAMSVVEAMQLGLVPVVTPVGEIGNYCRHGENALFVRTDEAAVDDIIAILHDDARYQTLRHNAVATWTGKPLYAESISAACKEILGPKAI